MVCGSVDLIMSEPNVFIVTSVILSPPKLLPMDQTNFDDISGTLCSSCVTVGTLYSINMALFLSSISIFIEMGLGQSHNARPGIWAYNSVYRVPSWTCAPTMTQLAIRLSLCLRPA